jgi:hypothetical protein
LWLAHQRPATIVVDTEHGERFRALLDSLGLSDSQRVAIDDLLGRYQENVEDTWQSLQPRLQVTMDSARQGIEALLDQTQLATFQQWLAIEHERTHGTGNSVLHH